MLATRALRRPLFIKWHGSEIELLETRSPIWRGLVDLLLRGTRAIGVLSVEEQRALQRHPRAPRVCVVRNALDLRRYTDRPDVRARLGIQPNAIDAALTALAGDELKTDIAMRSLARSLA